MGNYNEFDLDLQTEKIEENNKQERVSVSPATITASVTVSIGVTVTNGISLSNSVTVSDATKGCSASCHNCRP